MLIKEIIWNLISRHKKRVFSKLVLFGLYYQQRLHHDVFSVFFNILSITNAVCNRSHSQKKDIIFLWPRHCHVTELEAWCGFRVLLISFTSVWSSNTLKQVNDPTTMQPRCSFYLMTVTRCLSVFFCRHCFYPEHTVAFTAPATCRTGDRRSRAVLLLFTHN